MGSDSAVGTCPTWRSTTLMFPGERHGPSIERPHKAMPDNSIDLELQQKNTRFGERELLVDVTSTPSLAVDVARHLRLKQIYKRLTSVPIPFVVGKINPIVWGGERTRFKQKFG